VTCLLGFDKLANSRLDSITSETKSRLCRGAASEGQPNHYYQPATASAPQMQNCAMKWKKVQTKLRHSRDAPG